MAESLSDFVAGWAAGAASAFAVGPVDTVLTRVQSAAAPQRALGVAAGVVREGGARALWRGVAPLAVSAPLQNAVMFVAYGAGERYGREAGSGEYAAVLAGGCVGGVAQSFIAAPAELVKVRQQVIVGSGSSVGTVAVGRQALATAPFRGLGATVLRDGVPHAVWFGSYEWAKKRLAPEDGSPPGVLSSLAAGGFAAATAWAVGYPFDLIKTRIQAAATEGEAPTVARAARELLVAARGDPFRAYYHGFGLKLLRAVPASAVSFLVYEEVRRFIEGPSAS